MPLLPYRRRSSSSFIPHDEVENPDDEPPNSPEEHPEERSGTPRERVRLISTLCVTIYPHRDTDIDEKQYDGNSKDDEEFDIDRTSGLKCDRHDCALGGGQYKKRRGFRGHKSAIHGRETSEGGSSAVSTSYRRHCRPTRQQHTRLC